jgi:hypothetical protein
VREDRGKSEPPRFLDGPRDGLRVALRRGKKNGATVVDVAGLR